MILNHASRKYLIWKVIILFHLLYFCDSLNTCNLPPNNYDHKGEIVLKYACQYHMLQKPNCFDV